MDPQKILPKQEILKRMRALMADNLSEVHRPTRITLGVLARHLGVKRGFLYDYALKKHTITDVMQVRLSRLFLEIENKTLVLAVVNKKGVLVRSSNPPPQNTQSYAKVEWTENNPRIQWGRGKLWQS